MRATLRKRIERLAGRLNAGTKRAVLVFLLAHDATEEEVEGLVAEHEQTLDGRFGFLQIDDALLADYRARHGQQAGPLAPPEGAQG